MVGPFRVEEQIGEGAMARVYRIRHRDGSVRALKVLAVASPELRARIEDEGRVQSAMDHPCVVQVLDTMTVDGLPALVMEYVEGPNLEVFLQRHQMDLDGALQLMFLIASGVEAAHDLGIVHRDLNPRNIVMACSGQVTVPRLVDFGVSKMPEGDGRRRNTGQGMRLGTLGYQSPEQIQNASNVDGRTDLFSLGCIFYELLTNRRAFDGNNNMIVWSAVISGQYPPLPLDIPAPVRDIVTSLLQVNPDHRLSSIAEVLTLLGAQIEGDPLALVNVPIPSRQMGAIARLAHAWRSLVA